MPDIKCYIVRLKDIFLNNIIVVSFLRQYNWDIKNYEEKLNMPIGVIWCLLAKNDVLIQEKWYRNIFFCFIKN